jgi:hypothetical protein
VKRLAGLLLACLGALPVGAAEPAKQGQSAPPATGTVTLVCEAVYLPTRATWARTVTVAYDQRRIREVAIDGQPVYSFAIQGTLILTALDNERIQIDVASQTWSSDYRGLAKAQGRCERVV